MRSKLLGLVEGDIKNILGCNPEAVVMSCFARAYGNLPVAFIGARVDRSLEGVEEPEFIDRGRVSRCIIAGRLPSDSIWQVTEIPPGSQTYERIFDLATNRYQPPGRWGIDPNNVRPIVEKLALFVEKATSGILTVKATTVTTDRCQIITAVEIITQE